MLVAAAPWLAAAAPLGSTGTKAFDIARTADEASTAALEEGERTAAQLKDVVDPVKDAGTLRALEEEAEAAYQALVGYRRQAQVGVTEAFRVLGEASRLGAAAKPDPVRRESLEQHALLAAHEAAVMAARARAEAERLRAVLAEARAAIAGGRRPAGPSVERPAAGTEGSAAEVVVPNLVGARLEAAGRDLDVAGLRLGATTGPREGFVVKQDPEAGARVPRLAKVNVTFSATAATTTVPSP